VSKRSTRRDKTTIRSHSSGLAIRPPLRWAGSKRAVVPKLLEALPPAFDRYIEPFAGSACLFFKLAPRSAILGDINSELISAYRTLRTQPHAVWSYLCALQQNSRAYYKVRRIDGESLTAVQRTVRFLYLNRLCFNGVYRTNRSGHFNVPRGHGAGAGLSLEDLVRIGTRLRRATLVAGDFSTTLALAKRNDFVYLDPPYITARSREAGQYGYDSLAKSDLDRLTTCVVDLDERGVHFLLSFAISDALAEKLPVRQRKNLRVMRHVSGFRRGRRIAREMILSNYISR
jgi:DNA adenine methylase